jgi:choline-phosphate cytidylyltransferase/glycerol-3-phosphate cytidylyltransferase
LIERASKYGEVIVDVSSDELNMSKKSRLPIYCYEDRKEIIASNRHVIKVFKEESLEKKRDYILHHKADTLIMGDDWKGKFDHLNDICKVVYLPRTETISTTATIDKIKV